MLLMDRNSRACVNCAAYSIFMMCVFARAVFSNEGINACNKIQRSVSEYSEIFQT